ncbi:MAG: hypothetical protein ACD_59C00131G0001 [uncultured bacterium]|nr:MAG: hypothetical protein ACD_59C00131G0001 [uncultured bacterium]
MFKKSINIDNNDIDALKFSIKPNNSVTTARVLAGRTAFVKKVNSILNSPYLNLPFFIITHLNLNKSQAPIR